MLGSQRKMRLGDYVVHQKGFAFKSSQYTSSGHPIIRVSNFTDRSVDISNLYFISTDAIQQYDKFKVRCFDVVIATVGSWPENPASIVGKTICIPPECEGALLNQNAVILRSINELQQEYLFYLLKTQEFQEHIVSKAQGSANQASITLDDIFSFEFELPTLEHQNFVICQLRTLDKKIELNRKMNETLEAMAQALFKSWFVDFDGVAPEDMCESEMGLVPKEWRYGSIYEIANVTYGTPFASKLFNSEGNGRQLIRIRDLADESPSIWTPEVHPKGYLVQPGDIVVGMDGEFRAHLWGGKEAWLNQRVCVFKPNDTVSTAFVRNSIIAPLAYVEDSETATTVIHLGKSDIDQFNIIIPTKKMLELYGNVCQPLYDKIVANKLQSTLLTELREILLPKLISGQLRIKDAEKILGNIV